MSCVDIDQPPGALGCLPDCRFDVARCGDCGNGGLDPGEACDDGNAVAGDGCDGGSMELVNSTFTLNEAGNNLAGGALDCLDSTCEVANCVLWGDLPHELPQLTPSPFTMRYSLVEGGAAGEGNIDADPRFVDVSLGQLGLQAGSPAVDAADGALAPTLDYHGRPRHDAASVDYTGEGTPSYVDMGAIEWQPEGP